MRLISRLAIVLLLIAPRAWSGCDEADRYSESHDSRLTFVPWKILEPGSDPIDVANGAPLVLFWIPASRDELRRSELLTSRELAGYAAQCIGLEIVRPDDDEMIERLGATGSVPAALLVDRDLHVVARTARDSDGLRASAVTRMMRDALRAQEDAAGSALDEARRKLDAGERDAAVALYTGVWQQRCLFPREGRDAQRALRKLGVPVGRLQATGPERFAELRRRARGAVRMRAA